MRPPEGTLIAIGVPSGGRIKDVKVSNGSKVKRGQLLVQLDDSAPRAELVAARAKLNAAEARCSQLRNLFKAGAVTAVDMNAACGLVTVPRGELAPIQQRIEQTKVPSPIDGTVLERLTQPGETVNASAPLLRIADLTHLVAEADITEADIVKIHREQAVTVTSDAAADRVYEGKVYQISEIADKARGTVQVKVELHVPDLSLKPGMSVKCAFQPDKSAKPRIYVSREAILPQGGVWLVGPGNVVTHRAITTVAAAGSSVEVMSGLVGGERIVLDVNAVHEGQVLESGSGGK
jgi:membrane fusion protein (multidrug efflux system)